MENKTGPVITGSFEKRAPGPKKESDGKCRKAKSRSNQTKTYSKFYSKFYSFKKKRKE